MIDILGLPSQTLDIVLDGMMWRADTAICVTVAISIWFTGCVIASLAGLIAERLPGIIGLGTDSRTAISPPSACDGCGRPIPMLHLIPVIGWLLCAGRCGKCGHSIPGKYPLIEFAVGAASVIIPPVVGDTYLGLAALTLFWSCVVIVWCDIEHHIIPEFITVPLLIVGLLCSPIETDHWGRIAGAVVAGGAMLLSLIVVSKLRGVDAFSGGDVALLAVGGAWLGLSVTPAFMLLAGLAFLAYGIPLRRKGIEWVPMAPAIASSLVLCSLSPETMESLSTAMFS